MVLVQYQNGNAEVELLDDGTRTILFEEDLKLDFPLNIDIRVSSGCSLGYNSKTGKAVCEFCHESARTDGEECNYDELKSVLFGLPEGIELAIGGNKLTAKLRNFLTWCQKKGYICNLTVNHLQVNRFENTLRNYLELGLIKGLGISYRKGTPINFNEYFINHPNVVLHVIAGIDEVDDILSLPFKKVLILGEKDFGFNLGKVDLSSQNHKEWYWWVKKLIDEKDVVSFDNLAVEQLNIKRFFTNDKWTEFYQGEHSLYINAVGKYLSPSSRSNVKVNWGEVSIKEFFKQIEKK
jgi:hypothetical protein